MKKGGIITGGSSSIVALGDLGDPAVFQRCDIFTGNHAIHQEYPGNFIITIPAISLIAYWFGTVQLSEIHFSGLEQPPTAISSFHYRSWRRDRIEFWISVFAMTMVLVFENIGLVHGHVESINRLKPIKSHCRRQVFPFLFQLLVRVLPSQL